MLERHLRIGEALSDTDLIDKTAMEGGVNMVKGDPPLKFVAISDPILGIWLFLFHAKFCVC